ncbi:glycosyl hydrolase family 61-domain-containing protein [Mycena floridula]|nr:glycosyl hydrolase family 61-domain-containing protein [Mycena floridula]
MKFPSVFAAVALVQPVLAHYRFWQLISPDGTVTDEYEYVRKPNNYNSPVLDLTNTDMRCNAGADSGAGTKTMKVKAGDTVGIQSDVAAFHPGPFDTYLGKVPAGKTAANWDGSGAAWFKIWEEGPTISDNRLVFDQTQSKWTFKLPSDIPSGDYLLRHQHVGLHTTVGGEFFMSCAQLTVTGGGNASPSMVSIPGYIQATDPSVSLDIYDTAPAGGYTNPGPALFTGGSSGGASGSGGSTGDSSDDDSETSTKDAPSTTKATAIAKPTTSATSTSSKPVRTRKSCPTVRPTASKASVITSAKASSSTIATSTTDVASSPSASAVACTGAKDGYSCCYSTFNTCWAAADELHYAGKPSDSAACQSAYNECISTLSRRQTKRNHRSRARSFHH